MKKSWKDIEFSDADREIITANIKKNWQNKLPK